MSDLVGNTEDRFSHDEAHFCLLLLRRYKLKKPRFRTDAEEAGYSMVPSHQVAKIVKRKWATETEGKQWWLKVTGAQWDRVRFCLSIALNSG